jgi:hypothetical protein
MRRLWRFATFATLLGVRGMRGDWLLEQNPSCWTEPWALGALGALAVAYQAISGLSHWIYNLWLVFWKIHSNMEDLGIPP